MSDLSNDTKKHTTKSRETIPLKLNTFKNTYINKCHKEMLAVYGKNEHLLFCFLFAHGQTAA
jgi:hypothetical protein